MQNFKQNGKEFIPFKTVRKYKNVLAVDCFHPNAFSLSHWKGSVVPRKIQADTSTEIVLNAIQTKIPEVQHAVVTSNHFDVDGFLGVWSLFNPELAVEHKETLCKMAILGDFRELSEMDEEMILSIKLVCWINSKEKLLFYPPFGAQTSEEKEAAMCVQKFKYFLSTFHKILKNVIKYKSTWEPEYNEVINGTNSILGKNSFFNVPKIKLHVAQLPSPVHYYALFSQSKESDMVLSMYDDNKYELEYKYTTWVNAYDRLSFPRTRMNDLVQNLNLIENSRYEWSCENITDTGPILRLTSIKLLKEDRYDHPTKRTIHSSSISNREIIKIITDHFSFVLKSHPLKNDYSWKEMKNIG